jgi:hypothetical protein
MKNKIGMATISPTDHFPKTVTGMNFQGWDVISASFLTSFIQLSHADYKPIAFPKPKGLRVLL